MIDLQHLRTFVAVVAAKSFSRAAIELGCSQSTVTLHVKALEHELGALLLDRFRFARNFSLTTVGRRVYDSAPLLLMLAEEIRLAARRKQKE